MVREILDTAAMGTLRGILKERYGMGLQVKFIQEVNSPVGGEDDARLVGADLHFPIIVGEKFLATAVLEKGGKLQIAERETAGQLIRLFLEPELFTWYIEQVSNNFNATEKNVQSINSNDNVISINSVDFGNGDSFSPGLPLGSTFLYLESKNLLSFSRISSVVHEISGRWAFLNLKDVLTNIHSSKDLKSLGSLTLAIDEISVLPLHVQELIYQSLVDSSSESEPLMVIGSQTPLDFLEAEKLVLPQLAQLLRTQKLEADRLPKDPRLLQESLEIMLQI